MIINHKYRFIFIKTAKTAGTSIEIALSQFCGPGDVVTPINPDDEKLRQELGYCGPQNYKAKSSKFYRLLELLRLYQRTQVRNFKNHMPAELIQQNTQKQIWKDYFKFCFDRDPFDKAISRYYWKTRKLDSRPSISQFLEATSPHLLSNWHIYTINNEIAVDFIGRFETLADDLRRVSEKLHLPHELFLPKAKGGTRKDRTHYSRVLSASDRALIEEICANEISALNYAWQSRTDEEEPVNGDAPRT